MTTATTLVVSEVFGPTLQGEGAALGTRCAFIRLGACNLDCAWCDTPYTWDWSRYRSAGELHALTAAELLERVHGMDVPMVVITGGEPLLQQRRPAWGELLAGLHAQGLRIEVETNGTVAPSQPTARLVDRFTVSPKLRSSGVTTERRLVPEALCALRDSGRAVWKFVVVRDAQDEDLREIGDLIDAWGLRPVYVMPEARTAAQLEEGLRHLVPTALRDPRLHVTTRLQISVWGDERGH